MVKALGVTAIASAFYLLSSGAGFAVSCDGIADCRLVTAVPEPNVLALMATGLGALVITRFRKRK